MRATTTTAARTAATAALATLLLATPALADRAADAPLRAPNMLLTDHVAFTLRGPGWKQLVGTMEGTPAFGLYVVDRELAGGHRACQLQASVAGYVAARPPAVSGSIVRIRPTSQIGLVVYAMSRGRRGPVQWWAGTSKRTAAAAGGFQRLPRRLATKSHPYLVYTVTIWADVYPADNGQCAAFARTEGARIATRIARTMHIATGPPVSREPTAG